MKRYKNDMVVNNQNKSPIGEHDRKLKVHIKTYFNFNYKRLHLLYLYLNRVTPARVDKVGWVTLTALTIQSRSSVSGSI